MTIKVHQDAYLLLFRVHPWMVKLAIRIKSNCKLYLIAGTADVTTSQRHLRGCFLYEPTSCRNVAQFYGD
ncbi:hypothetical protein KM043_018174 [Ampulex compressa]|nr:hypothetical protein KM043_018174 [Ampulex compressa]